MSKSDALLTEKQMRDIFNYHKKYNKLEYTFYQFVDFCKKYSMNFTRKYYLIHLNVFKIDQSTS